MVQLKPESYGGYSITFEKSDDNRDIKVTLSKDSDRSKQYVYRNVNKSVAFDLIKNEIDKDM